MSEPDRLCLWCKHYSLDTGSPGYSELTPGSDMWMSCAKNVWRWDAGNDFYATIRTAERCQHYEFNAALHGGKA
jgi:hypothetical protein